MSNFDEKQAVVFDIEGSLGMFRRPYTTTSSVSYPIPPPTAIAGILGAILGIENGSGTRGGNALYWKQMVGSQVAIAIRKPIRFASHSLNLLNTKNPDKFPRIQVKHQFLKDPAFRVYYKGPLGQKLTTHLEEGIFPFSPFLGVAYAPARIRFIGHFPLGEAETGKGIDSVVPCASPEPPPVDLKATGELEMVVMPFQMTFERRLMKSVSVLFHPRGGKIFLKGPVSGGEVSRVGLEQVCWFDPWKQPWG